MHLGIDLDGVVYDFDKIARDTFLTRSLPEPLTESQRYKLHRPALGWDGLGETVGKKNWGWLWENAPDLKIFDRLAPIPGAVEAMRELIEGHYVWVLTSRPKGVEDQTYRWLAAYNLKPRGVIHTSSKYALVQGFHLDVVVDDSPEQLRQYLMRTRGQLKGLRIYGVKAPWNERSGIETSYYRFAWVDHLRDVAEDVRELAA